MLSQYHIVQTVDAGLQPIDLRQALVFVSLTSARATACALPD